MAAFLLAAAGVALTAGLGAAALRLPSFSTFLLAAYVLAAAEVVAAGEVLSLAHAIGVAGYAAFEAVAAVIVAAVWLAVGRPVPPAPTLPRDWTVAVLGVVVGAAFVYEAFLVVGTPPNNWDSMHYHLARVAAWRQQGSLAYFPTHNAIENAYPQNAELLVLPTLVVAGRDVVAAVPQLLAQLATALGIYVLARRIGAPRSPAVLAALLLPTLTIVALESVTTQNDLVEASFVVAGLALALGRSRRELVLAGLALGLAAGTKFTALFALPVVVVAVLLMLPRRRAAELAAWTVLGVALFGAYAYIQNGIETGKPLGRTRQSTLLRPDVTAGGTASTVLRTAYGLVDLSGFHPPGSLVQHVAGAAKRVFDALGVPPNPSGATTPGTFRFAYQPKTDVSEDASSFGPLGFALVVPLSLGTLVAWVLRRTDRRHGALALALPIYVVALALGTRWNPYVGRFLVTPVALTLPLAPLVLRFRAVAAAAVVLATATICLAHVFNPSKPTGVAGGEPIWSRSRVDAQTIRFPELRGALTAVAATVPANARLGIDLGAGDWEYPLYGPRPQRRLVFLPRRRPLDRASGLDWVVLGAGTGGVRHPGWCATRFPASGWTLLRRGTGCEG
jgi:hypothetical protein